MPGAMVMEDDPSVGLFETTRDLLLVESPEGFIIKTSASLRHLLSYPETELDGKALFDFVCPDDISEVSGALQTPKLGDQTTDFEYRCCAADGSYPVLHWHVSKHEATGIRYWVGRDVTERKRMEVLLAGQAHAINSSQAVIEFHMDGTIIAANERFLALTEYRASDIIGRHHRILVQPEYAASQEYSRFWQALNRGEFQAGEFERFTRKGQSVWMQATYTPILGLDASPKKS